MPIEFLPPYSPDFNPIEQSFVALKAWMRRNNTLVNSFTNFEEFVILSIYQFARTGDPGAHFRSAHLVDQKQHIQKNKTSFSYIANYIQVQASSVCIYILIIGKCS